MAQLFIDTTGNTIKYCVLHEGVVPNINDMQILTLSTGININNNMINNMTDAQRHMLNVPLRARRSFLSDNEERKVVALLADALQLNQPPETAQVIGYQTAARIEQAVNDMDTPSDQLGATWRWQKTDVSAIKGPNAEAARFFQDFYFLSSRAYPMAADLFLSVALHECMRRCGSVAPASVSLICDEEAHAVDFRSVVLTTRRSMPLQWGEDAPDNISVSVKTIGKTVSSFIYHMGTVQPGCLAAATVYLDHRIVELLMMDGRPIASTVRPNNNGTHISISSIRTKEVLDHLFAGGAAAADSILEGYQEDKAAVLHNVLEVLTSSIHHEALLAAISRDTIDMAFTMLPSPAPPTAVAPLSSFVHMMDIYADQGEVVPVLNADHIPLIGAVLMDTGRLIVGDGTMVTSPVEHLGASFAVNGRPCNNSVTLSQSSLFAHGPVGVIMVEVMTIGTDMVSISHPIGGDMLTRNYSATTTTGTHADRDNENVGLIMLAVRQEDLGHGPITVTVLYDGPSQKADILIKGSTSQVIRSTHHIYADAIDLCYDTTTNLVHAVVPLLNDSGYEAPQRQGGKRHPPHQMLAFLGSLHALLDGLQPTPGSDVAREAYSDLLSAFRPSLQVFLNSKPWEEVCFYINMQGRETSEIIQTGIKEERRPTYAQVDSLIYRYNTASADHFDVDMLLASSSSSKALAYETVWQSVLRCTDVAAVSHSGKNTRIRQSCRQLLKCTDPQEIVVIDDSDDEEEEEEVEIINDDSTIVADIMEVDQEGLVDWTVFLD